MPFSKVRLPVKTWAAGDTNWFLISSSQSLKKSTKVGLFPVTLRQSLWFGHNSSVIVLAPQRLYAEVTSGTTQWRRGAPTTRGKPLELSPADNQSSQEASVEQIKVVKSCSCSRLQEQSLHIYVAVHRIRGSFFCVLCRLLPLTLMHKKGPQCRKYQWKNKQHTE